MTSSNNRTHHRSSAGNEGTPYFIVTITNYPELVRRTQRFQRSHQVGNITLLFLYRSCLVFYSRIRINAVKQPCSCQVYPFILEHLIPKIRNNYYTIHSDFEYSDLFKTIFNKLNEYIRFIWYSICVI